MNKQHILVFGSLREKSKRGYNFNRFGGQEFVKPVTLNGFEMYDLGAYPTICEGEGSIQCELHTVEPDAFKNIQRMEKGAGYEEKTVDVDGVQATIFVWDKKQIERYGLKRVDSGDWN